MTDEANSTVTDEILQEKMSKQHGLSGYQADLKIHPVHLCHLFSEYVEFFTKEASGFSERARAEHLYFRMTHYIFRSLAYMTYIHRDQGVPLLPHEKLPILRVCAMSEYLRTPHRMTTTNFKALTRLAEGEYDRELAQGINPSILTHREASGPSEPSNEKTPSCEKVDTDSEEG